MLCIRISNDVLLSFRCAHVMQRRGESRSTDCRVITSLSSLPLRGEGDYRGRGVLNKTRSKEILDPSNQNQKILVSVGSRYRHFNDSSSSSIWQKSFKTVLRRFDDVGRYLPLRDVGSSNLRRLMQEFDIFWTYC